MRFSRRGQPAATVPDPHGARLVFGVALAWLVFLVYPVLELARLWPHAASLAAGVVGLCCLVALYVWVMWRAARAQPGRREWLAVAVFVGLGVALPYVAGPYWHGQLLYVPVMVGFLLPAARALVACAVVALLAAVNGLLIHAHAAAAVAVPPMILLAGVVTVALSALLTANRELRAARGEIERLAAGEERVRLARDLHDSVKQHLFTAGMEVGATRALLDGDSHAAAEHLEDLNVAVRGAQRDLAAVIEELRPTGLEGRGLAEALRAHVTSWARGQHVDAGVSVYALSTPVPVRIGDVLFLAAREALVNVARHAGAGRVDVELHSDARSVTLAVTDDGSGFAAGAMVAGHGLTGIRERLAALGGSVDVDSAPGVGTTFTCSCPRTPEVVNAATRPLV